MGEMKMVEVEWLDSTCWSSWRDVETARKDAIEDSLAHRSAGYLLADQEDRIVLALSQSGDGERVSDVQAIPRAVVTSIRELRRK